MTRRYSLGVVGGVITGLAFGLSLDAWGGKSSGATSAIANAKVADADPRKVELSPQLAKRARLRLEPAREEALAPTLRLVGSVDFDANKVTEVGARIEGRVARMLVSVGDVVKRGDALVEIESNELGEAFAALLGARANLIAAENHEARESALAAQQLSSAPVVERARAEVKALRAQVRGAEQRLLAMGFTPEEIAQVQSGRGLTHVTLRAPLAGEVVDRYAVLGQVVSPTEPVLRIADLDRVWVELDVFERDLARVAEGDAVDICSETHPGKVFQGRVTHVGATVELSTRTAQVRVEVENSERLLRPGQFVQALLATSGGQRTALTVPRSALLQVEGEASVFVSLGENKYIARPVEIADGGGDRAEIRRGLAAGDLVVAEGAFVLKSELLR